jgi:hypothetical protein
MTSQSISRKRKRGVPRTAKLLALVGLSVAALCTPWSQTTSADRLSSRQLPLSEQKDSRAPGTEALPGLDFSSATGNQQGSYLAPAFDQLSSTTQVASAHLIHRQPQCNAGMG